MKPPVPEGGAGVLLWDKPAGLTSHDVVSEIRRQTGMKAGHVGTLDPFATGLLVILLGRATRLQRYLVGLRKGYLATALYGWTSSTGDPDGELAETGRIPADLEIPTGSFDQQVPMTSAARVAGERLYRKAHRGETVIDRPSRQVSVFSSELVEVERGRDDLPVRGRYELLVSSGTYVRSLISDLGDAYCEALRRTSVGEFELGDAGSLVAPLDALSFLALADLDPGEVRAIENGVPIEDRWQLGGSDPLRLADGPELVAVGRPDHGTIKPEVVLRPAAG